MEGKFARARPLKISSVARPCRYLRLLVSFLSRAGTGGTSQRRPDEGDRPVEFQHPANTKGAGQLYRQAGQPAGGTSPVPPAARAGRVLQGKRDRRHRVLVLGGQRRPRSAGDELDVMSRERVVVAVGLY